MFAVCFVELFRDLFYHVYLWSLGVIFFRPPLFIFSLSPHFSILIFSVSGYALNQSLKFQAQFQVFAARSGNPITGIQIYDVKTETYS